MEYFEEYDNGDTEPRTFYQIVREEFDGDLMMAMKHFDISDSASKAFIDFLKGNRVREFVSGTLKKICIETAENEENLFPKRLHKERLFISLKDTPGFKQLQKTKGLVFKGRRKIDSLSKFFLDKGLTNSEISLMHHYMLGYLPIYQPAITLCERLAVDHTEFFPVEIYGRYEYREKRGNRANQRIRQEVSIRAIPVSESNEAQQKLNSASYKDRTLVRDEVTKLTIENIFAILSEKQRTAFSLRFGFNGKALKFEEIAEVMKLQDRRFAQMIISGGIKKIRRRFKDHKFFDEIESNYLDFEEQPSARIIE